MNPVVFTAVVFIVWGVGGALGYLAALERQGQARITLQFRISDLERELTNTAAELRATSAEKAEWRKLAVSWQTKAHRFKLMADKLTDRPWNSTDTATLADPPSTREADRRAAERRRAQEEERDSASDTRRAVGVSDDEAAPVPQLRDAEDDH